MFKIFTYILILLFHIGYVQAEIIKKIDINGNNRVSEETIKVYGDLQINKDYNDKELNQVLQNLYSTEFFEDIKISVKNNTLTINLKEYPVVINW